MNDSEIWGYIVIAGTVFIAILTAVIITIWPEGPDETKDKGR